MKRLLVALAVAIGLLLSARAVANPIPCGGAIAAYGDAGGTRCDILDVGPNVLNIYFIHIPWGGPVRGSRFAAPQPECFVATHVSDVYSFPGVTEGDFRTGLTITYGACVSDPVLIGYSIYSIQGLTEQCCFYLTLGHPDSPSGQLQALNCDDEWIDVGLLGYAQINPNANWCVSPVETNSWGEIKALYEADE